MSNFTSYVPHLTNRALMCVGMCMCCMEYKDTP